MSNITLEVFDNRIGVATIDMPNRPFNVFSEEMMSDLESVVMQACAELQGLVISSGKRSFLAGADLVMIKDFARMRFDADRAEMKRRFSRLGRLFRSIEQSPIPIVAAVNGLALGGGLEVAMACHARVCIDVDAPILGLPEIKLGLLPGAGGTQRLPRIVGVERGLQMLLAGDPVTPADALNIGLVDRVVAASELVGEAVKLAGTIAPRARWDEPGWSPAESDLALARSDELAQLCVQWGGWATKQHDLYPAVDSIVRCVSEGFALSIDDGSEVEWDIFVDLMSDPVAANMVVTSFLNKGSADAEGSDTLRDELATIIATELKSSDVAPALLGAALRAVDALGLAKKVGVDLHLSDEDCTSEDRVVGFELLGRIACAVLQKCDSPYEVIDALSVLKLRWPAWTGGPAAFLAMIQRDELGGWEPSAKLSGALSSIDHDLKIKASYSSRAS
jgi:3-hydroxyacyl-CoA dehydrogenase/enoyl-CoA hydratase/3-hydroxybutyryl-CoA epimerase